MVRCEFDCLYCATQVFLLPGMTELPDLRCPGCGRLLRPGHLEPFGEKEWLACAEPHILIQFRVPPGRLTERKRRLFLVACWHQLAEPPVDERQRWAMTRAERHADDLASTAELDHAHAHVSALTPAYPNVPSFLHIIALAATASQPEPRMAFPSYHPTGARIAPGKGAAVCALYRDIVGNPFRPTPVINPLLLAWDGGVIQHLARELYAARAFDRLAILGDALEEAGCADGDLLDHCRSPGPHVRGCWAVDLLVTAGEKSRE